MGKLVLHEIFIGTWKDLYGPGEDVSETIILRRHKFDDEHEAQKKKRKLEKRFNRLYYKMYLRNLQREFWREYGINGCPRFMSSRDKRENLEPDKLSVSYNISMQDEEPFIAEESLSDALREEFEKLN